MTPKSIVLAGTFVLALTMPAFAEDTADHAAHHTAAAAAPAVTPGMTQPTPVGPGGTMMNCPMMSNGHTAMMPAQAPTGAPAQQHMGGGGNPVPMASASDSAPMQGGMMQGGMMDKDHMAQCPMMKAPDGTANPPPPAATQGDGHTEHHPSGQ